MLGWHAVGWDFPPHRVVVTGKVKTGQSGNTEHHSAAGFGFLVVKVPKKYAVLGG